LEQLFKTNIVPCVDIGRIKRFYFGNTKGVKINHSQEIPSITAEFAISNITLPNHFIEIFQIEILFFYLLFIVLSHLLILK
jgi:hypothetical protein